MHQYTDTLFSQHVFSLNFRTSMHIQFTSTFQQRDVDLFPDCSCIISNLHTEIYKTRSGPGYVHILISLMSGPSDCPLLCPSSPAVCDWMMLTASIPGPPGAVIVDRYRDLSTMAERRKWSGQYFVCISSEYEAGYYISTRCVANKTHTGVEYHFLHLSHLPWTRSPTILRRHDLK